LNEINKSLSGRKLIIFPATIDFGYMAQRPQHMAHAFAKAGFVVIYATLNHKVDRVETTEQITENLYLLHEFHFPLLSYVFKPKNTIYYCLWANNAKHLEIVPYSYLMYDYMDDLSLLDLPSNQLQVEHLRMLEKADLITVSADKLIDGLPKQFLSKALLVNNAVSREFIDLIDTENMDAQKAKREKRGAILGYYGAISEWFDFDLIDRLASELPDANIALIGPVSELVSKRVSEILWSHKNIFLLPPCKQLDLVPMLKLFDVCLIPFIKNNVTEAVSPVKLFEYLSAGKPVVTSDLAECGKYLPIHVCKTHEQFISVVKSIMAGSTPNLSMESRQIALENTWTHRINQIVAEMQK
jgi:hypothetical protein